jgi:hypothetical protein
MEIRSCRCCASGPLFLAMSPKCHRVLPAPRVGIDSVAGGAPEWYAFCNPWILLRDPGAETVGSWLPTSSMPWRVVGNRWTKVSFRTLAGRTGLHWTTVERALRSLERKLSFETVCGPYCALWIGTEYCVYSYKQILQRRTDFPKRILPGYPRQWALYCADAASFVAERKAAVEEEHARKAAHGAACDGLDKNLACGYGGTLVWVCWCEKGKALAAVGPEAIESVARKRLGPESRVRIIDPYAAKFDRSSRTSATTLGPIQPEVAWARLARP